MTSFGDGSDVSGGEGEKNGEPVIDVRSPVAVSTLNPPMKSPSLLMPPPKYSLVPSGERPGPMNRIPVEVAAGVNVSSEKSDLTRIGHTLLLLRANDDKLRYGKGLAVSLAGIFVAGMKSKEPVAAQEA